MKTKWKIVGVVGLVGIALLAWALAFAPAYGHGRFGRGGSHEMMWGGHDSLSSRLLRGLDLTEEQYAKVREIQEAHQPKFRELWSQMYTVRKEMIDTLFSSGEVAETDLQSHVKQLGTLREQLMQEGLMMALEVRAVLTPEQLAKAVELKDRMQKLHDEMRSLFHKDQ
jgi:Spy/CpxP family protein refolding chaperone